MPAVEPRPAPPGRTPRDEGERYRAPALDKGLDILELLSEHAHGLTRAEIVKAMGRSPGEIYRMLERLVARDYVSRSSEGDRYALSLKLFVLGARHPPVSRLVARAQPVMEALADAVEQSCHLCVYDRGNLSVVAQVASPGRLSFGLRLGARVSLLDTASGQVLLAFQDEARRAEMVAAHDALEGEAPLSADDLAAALERVRRQGHWFGPSRQSFGITDISAPVRAPGGPAIAALTCPYVRRIDRRGGPAPEAVRERLIVAARSLSTD